MSLVSGIERALERWGAAVTRRAIPILLALPLVTGLLFRYAVHTLGVDTGTGGMVSDDLPYRQAARAFDLAFPELGDALIVVVEGETPGLAEDAAATLAARLREDTVFASVYEPGGGEFFRRHALLYGEPAALERRVDRVGRLSPLLLELERDPTLGGLARALEGAMPREEVDLAPVLGLLARTVHGASTGRYVPLPWAALLLGRPPLPSDSRRTIVARPREVGGGLPRRAAVERARAEATAAGLTLRDGVRVRLTGSVAIEHEELVSAIAAAREASLLALVAVGLILWLALRSVRLIVACLATLLAGLVATAAFAGAAVGRLNLISVAFAVLYIGLGIDYAIHLALRYRAAREAGAGSEPAVRRAAGEVGTSIVLSALTTAACFYAFVPTDFAGVSQLGVIGGTGMFISLAATLTILPAFLHAWPPPVPTAAESGAAGRGKSADPPPAGAHGDAGPLAPSGLPRLARTVHRHGSGVLGAAVVLTGASLVLVPRVRFDHDPLSLRDPESESVRAYRSLLADSAGGPLTISVLCDEPRAATALAARLERLDVVAGTRRIEDFVPTRQEPKLRAIRHLAARLGPPPGPAPSVAAPSAPADSDLPEGVRALERVLVQLRWRGSRAEAEAARRLHHVLRRWEDFRAGWPAEARARLDARLEEASLGTLPGRMDRLRASLRAGAVTFDSLPDALVDRWIGRGGERRIEVLPARALTTSDRIREFVDAVRGVAPDATGPAVQQLETGRVAVDAFRTALGAAVVATCLLLFVLFREVAPVLVVVGPLLAAGVWTGAATVALSLPFNFANVIALPLLLGVGVDNGIHMVHQGRLAWSGTGGASGPGEPLRSSTARAVLYATLTTVAGFGNLAFARHIGMASMGRLLTVGMTCVLAATLLLIPAVLARLESRRAGPGRSDGGPGDAGAA